MSLGSNTTWWKKGCQNSNQQAGRNVYLYMWVLCDINGEQNSFTNDNIRLLVPVAINMVSSFLLHFLYVHLFIFLVMVSLSLTHTLDFLSLIFTSFSYLCYRYFFLCFQLLFSFFMLSLSSSILKINTKYCWNYSNSPYIFLLTFTVVGSTWVENTTHF